MIRVILISTMMLAVLASGGMQAPAAVPQGRNEARGLVEELMSHPSALRLRGGSAATHVRVKKAEEFLKVDLEDKGREGEGGGEREKEEKKEIAVGYLYAVDSTKSPRSTQRKIDFPPP